MNNLITTTASAPQTRAAADYRARLAATPADVAAAQTLRFEVFNLELDEGLDESWKTGRDEDPFDAQCDHLIVEEPSRGAVVGTYRLQTLERARAGIGFYSAGEFDLSGLPSEVLGGAVEIGRACIAKPYRNRRVLYLLWRGLAEYVLAHGKRYLFGCSSLTSQDPAVGLRAYADLARSGHLHEGFEVLPNPGFECADDGSWRDLAPVRLPILFHTYLRHGAKVCGPPAIDRAFKTIDFLMLIDLAAMDPETLRLFAPDVSDQNRGA